MARKPEIKQFRQACKEAGLTAEERYQAGEALHAEKESSGEGEHAAYSDLLAGCKNGSSADVPRSALDASPINVLRTMRDLLSARGSPS